MPNAILFPFHWKMFEKFKLLKCFEHACWTVRLQLSSQQQISFGAGSYQKEKKLENSPCLHKFRFCLNFSSCLPPPLPFSLPPPPPPGRVLVLHLKPARRLHVFCLALERMTEFKRASGLLGKLNFLNLQSVLTVLFDNKVLYFNSFCHSGIISVRPTITLADVIKSTLAPKLSN